MLLGKAQDGKIHNGGLKVRMLWHARFKDIMGKISLYARPWSCCNGGMGFAGKNVVSRKKQNSGLQPPRVC